MNTQEILSKLKIETRHFSEVFKSTVGVPSNATYFYRIENEIEIKKELMGLGMTDSEAQKLIDEYAQNK